MFKPILDWVFLKDIPANALSAGGIYLTTNEQKKILQGEVAMVGPGVLQSDHTFCPTTVQPGEKVAYPPYVAKVVTIDNVEYVVVRERDILAVW